MRVVVRSELGEVAPAWDEMAAGQDLPSPFLRAWWVSNAASGAPAVVLCLDGDRFVGGAAFEVDRVGRGPLGLERVRTLGQGVLAPDHLDVIAEPGRAPEVLERVVGWLRRPGNRIVDLDGLAAGGRLATALAGHELERVGAPWTPLPPDPATYLAERPGRLRSTIKRTAKRMDKAGARTRMVAPEEADEALDTLARLHDGRWADDSEFLGAWQAFRRAATAGMATGAVVIHEAVDAEGTVIATELDLVTAGRVAFYQAGRSTDHDWRGAGSVLKADVIHWAIESGCTEYDLLRGDESYKSDWAAQRRELLRVRFGVGTAGQVVAAGADAWRRALPLVQRSTERWRALRHPAGPGATSPPT